MNELRGAARSKTVWLGLLVVITGFLHLNLPQLKIVLASFVRPESLEPLFATIQLMLGLLVVLVRFYTDESLAMKGRP